MALHLFGSSIVKKYIPEAREPVDIDYVTNNLDEWIEVSNNGPKTDALTGKRIEYHYLPFLPNRELTLGEIWALKKAHAMYDVQWFKTMGDIKFLENEATLPMVTSSDFRHGAAVYFRNMHYRLRTNFDVSLEEFFDDNVDREIPHDDLHELLSDSPSYKKIVRPGSPKPHKSLFDDLSPVEQDEVLWEEAFVIAIERYRKLKLPYTAYYEAQRDLVTRLHPAWLAEIVIKRWAFTMSYPRESESFMRYKELYKKEKLR